MLLKIINMGNINNNTVAFNFRIITRSIILLIGAIVFSIAFVYGIDDFKGSFDGISMNSQYSIIWLAFIYILYISWVWELAGGITIFLLSISSLYFFIVYDSNFIISPIPFIVVFFILSILLIYCWYLNLHEEK